jgi:hypothetical protein
VIGSFFTTFTPIACLRPWANLAIESTRGKGTTVRA